MAPLSLEHSRCRLLCWDVIPVDVRQTMGRPTWS